MRTLLGRLLGNASPTAITRPLVLDEEVALARTADDAPIPAAKDLEEEVARASMTGVRRAWSPETAVDGLTPDKLSGILRRANQGDMDALLTLAEEMEERDPHYASVLQTRKLAVAGLERQLTWSPGHEDHPKADEIHEACAQLIAEPAFEDLIWHSLDAIAKGYAAPEILWDTKANQWRPCGYAWRDPRFFQFDRETGQELRLKEIGQIDGAPLPPFKFATIVAGRKSGLAARGGLARLVAFSFVCKLYGVKDWMAYAEIFGIPLRLGKYGAGASAEDVEVLKRAVFGLGSDAAAVVPESMKIEFPTLGAAGGAELFLTLANWLDGQVSKAVVGQTGTTDMQKGGGFAQSKVLNEVRGDLTKADAKWLGASATSSVLAAFVLFNWGPTAPVPNLTLIVEEPEDVTVLSEALERLVPLGLKVDQAEIRKKLKLSEPGKDAELLSAPKAAAPTGIQPIGAPPADPDPKDPTATARDQRQVALARIEEIFAQARARREVADAQLDEVQLAALDGWEKSWGQDVAAVMDLASRVESFEAFAAGLDELARDLSAPLAARSLANAMFQAAVIGQTQVRRKA